MALVGTGRPLLRAARVQAELEQLAQQTVVRDKGARKKEEEARAATKAAKGREKEERAKAKTVAIKAL